MPPLLAVENLSVELTHRSGKATLVENVSLTLAPGERLGLVGESGAGKSMLGQAILGLLDPPIRRSAGRILFQGTDLGALNERALRQLRGREMSLIAQDALAALNPLFPIGAQLAETLRVHAPLTKAEAETRALDLITQVGLSHPADRLKQFPHELSGGMRQRVVIALALANNPKLIIADEPTTALDVSVQAQILDLLKALLKSSGSGLILISHDLSVIAEMTDRVAVLYAGRIVESGPTAEVIGNPQHPYTQGLIKAVPQIGRKTPLVNIRGTMPPATARPTGCPFHPRCPVAFERCPGEEPDLKPLTAGNHSAACFRVEGADA